MPNPVVSFEVRGPDPERLHAFYRDAFGWDVYVFGVEYAGVETAAHINDEDTGATTYTGADSMMNGAIEMNEDAGHRGWRFEGEANYREFVPGFRAGSIAAHLL